MPRTVRLGEAPSFGQPIIVFDSTSRGRQGVPRSGERGEPWRDAADWVRDSARSSRRGERAPTGDGRRPGLQEIPVVGDPARTRTSRATTSTRRRSARSPTRSARSGVLQPVLVRPVGRRLRADRGRAALAGGPPGRACRRSRRWSGRPTTRRARAGAGREPPPRRPQPARGGRRLPAAHRGLRPHPRARSRPGSAAAGPSVDQHAAAAPAPARDPAHGAARRSSRWATPARCSGTPDRAFQEQLATPDRQGGPLGAGGRGGGPRARRPRPTPRPTGADA